MFDELSILHSPAKGKTLDSGSWRARWSFIRNEKSIIENKGRRWGTTPFNKVNVSVFAVSYTVSCSSYVVGSFHFQELPASHFYFRPFEPCEPSEMGRHIVNSKRQ